MPGLQGRPGPRNRCHASARRGRQSEPGGKHLRLFRSPEAYLDAAPDGVTGLHLASTHIYDAIVLDWNIPRMDGFEVLRKIREGKLAGLPVLMLTARDELPDKVAGFRAGGRRLPHQTLRAGRAGGPSAGAGRSDVGHRSKPNEAGRDRAARASHRYRSPAWRPTASPPPPSSCAPSFHCAPALCGRCASAL